MFGMIIYSSGLVYLSRFKQLKEQEAQRRRQREEEKKENEEVAAKGIQITNEEVKKEVNVLEKEDRTHAELLDADSVTSVSSSSTVDGFVMNGNNTNSELKDDQKTSACTEENAETFEDQENRNNRHLYEKVEKVILVP